MKKLLALISILALGGLALAEPAAHSLDGEGASEPPKRFGVARKAAPPKERAEIVNGVALLEELKTRHAELAGPYNDLQKSIEGTGPHSPVLQDNMIEFAVLTEQLRFEQQGRDIQKWEEKILGGQLSGDDIARIAGNLMRADLAKIQLIFAQTFRTEQAKLLVAREDKTLTAEEIVALRRLAAREVLARMTGPEKLKFVLLRKVIRDAIETAKDEPGAPDRTHRANQKLFVEYVKLFDLFGENAEDALPKKEALAEMKIEDGQRQLKDLSRSILTYNRAALVKLNQKFLAEPEKYKVLIDRQEDLLAEAAVK